MKTTYVMRDGELVEKSKPERPVIEMLPSEAPRVDFAKLIRGLEAYDRAVGEALMGRGA